MSAADIRSHAAKKKVVAEAGPSRSSKKSQVATPSVSIRKSDILSETVPEPVLPLSARTMLLLTEVLSTEARMVRDEGATAEPSVAPSVEV